MRILIIGGGASGMILASMLKVKNGDSITILEKNAKLGRKLLLTGNGKCNFTSGDFDDLKSIYNNDFAINLYKKADYQDYINYLISVGIVPKLEIHKGQKYYYPMSNKSTSVYYALYDKLIENGVEIIYNFNVSNIESREQKFLVSDGKNFYEGDKIVICSGGMSYKKTGSDGSIYKILSKLGHNIIKPIPGLVGFGYNDSDLKYLKGVRAYAKVSAKVYNSEKIIKEYIEIGEIQFTENYLSGIPVMNLSSKINRYICDGLKVKIIIDFYNNLFDEKNDNEDEKAALIDYLRDRKNKIYYKLSKDFLCGFLQDEIANVIIKRSNVKCDSVRDISEKDLESIADNIINFVLKEITIGDFNVAQITLGGIDTKDIDINTLQSRIIKNMYFAGEVIDIDGKCGGYNLQLAYSTAKIVANEIYG